MVDVSPSQFWREALGSLHIWKDGSSRAVHKPLLSLLVIARAAARAENRFRFKELDAPLPSLLQEFGPPRKAHHPEYPFWHLQTDGFWKIDGATVLPKMKDGSPSRGTLLQEDAAGRIPEDLWRALVSSPELRTELAQNLLHSFWPQSLHEAIKAAVGLPEESAMNPTGKKRRRDPHFRDLVLRAYQRKCAICGYDGRLANAPLLSISKCGTDQDPRELSLWRASAEFPDGPVVASAPIDRL